jgi:hypothetical protein
MLAALAPACRDEDPANAKQLANSDATFTVTDASPGVCEQTRCFEVTSSKELSFIAVDAACPTASGITLELYRYVNGSLEKVNIDPAPHGEGDPCSGTGVTVPASALKFEGLTDPKYLVCVAFDGVPAGGSVDIYAKAGTSCAAEEFDDCVCSGTDTSGSGSTGSTGGTGGAGGAGGAGGTGATGGTGGTGATGGTGGSGATGGSGGAGGCGDCGDCGCDDCGDCDGCDDCGGCGWGGWGGGGGWWGTGGGGGWWGTGGGCP